jgi:hypothetical protein
MPGVLIGVFLTLVLDPVCSFGRELCFRPAVKGGDTLNWESALARRPAPFAYGVDVEQILFLHEPK